MAIVGSRYEADLMVGLLLNHDVDARSSGDDAGAVDLALQSQGVRVIVNDIDQEVAREILGLELPSTVMNRPFNRFEAWLIRLLGGNKPSNP